MRYQEFDEQIDGLLAAMTLREKIGQLNQIPEPKTPEQAEAYKERIRRGEIGSIILASSATAGNEKRKKGAAQEDSQQKKGAAQEDSQQKKNAAQEDGWQSNINTALCNELQRAAMEESPRHIPLIFGRDVIHGHHTVYPIPLACAASFNEELVEKCYRNIAREAAAEGVHWAFAPMLDLSRDPRWGRVIEGPGEDPYVAKVMGRACIRGFQGEDLKDPDSLAACAKHYIGYGASEGGRDYHRTEIADYSLYNYYLPAFRAAVEAGAATVMSSFNDISGQPVTSGRKYLTDILRGQLGFEGFVVSDWAAVQMLMRFGVAGDRADCARLALHAGVDMDMVDGCYGENLEALVNSGQVPEEELDNAVRRILRIKFAKGLFDRPYCEPRRVDRAGHLADARALAAESMVLLKNEGVLPLKKDVTVALLGPFVHEKRSLLGSWTLDYQIEDTASLLEAMEEKLGREHILFSADETGLYDDSVHTAAKADVVLLALGESWEATGERRCLSDISLSPSQQALIHRMKALGKKVVGIFFCGRPLAMEGVAEQLDAILYAWHSGTKTAEAVCDILFGDVVPSGKTAMTFPRRTGHIPLYYNVTSSGNFVNGYYGEEIFPCYLDSVASPAYPFGYGLSYTTFAYGPVTAEKTRLSLQELEAGKRFRIAVTVENTGDYDGKEVVQLYIHDRTASRMRPLRELKAFQKPLIRRGEAARLRFELGYADLGFYTEQGEYLVEPGSFDIYVGGNCLADNRIRIEVL